MNERMNTQMNEQWLMNDWIPWMKEWMNEHVNEQTNKWMNGWTKFNEQLTSLYQLSRLN